MTWRRTVMILVVLVTLLLSIAVVPSSAFTDESSQEECPEFYIISNQSYIDCNIDVHQDRMWRFEEENFEDIRKESEKKHRTLQNVYQWFEQVFSELLHVFSM